MKSRILIATIALVGWLLVGWRPVAIDNLRFTGSFESGQIQRSGSAQDGFYIQTLPDPQGDVDYVKVSSGGAGPDSGLDTRVVSSERVGSETVRPRKGNYFLRSALYFDKDYSRMTHNSGCQCNKPRSTIMMGHPDLRFQYDEEAYLGFSIFTPRNQENELGVKGNRGGNGLLSTKPNSSTRTQFVLTQYVGKSQNEMHWWLLYYVGDSSTQESDGKGTWVDLGPVGPDRGRWTDFVIRFRFNPFLVDTNPVAQGIPNAMNKLFRGNKGILQVWKAEGGEDQNRDRSMILKIDKVNEPVGLVAHKSDIPHHSFRIYKFGWHENPTTVTGPVWFGFDEIRFGTVIQDGTTYADVYPGSIEGNRTRPKPPILSANM